MNERITEFSMSNLNYLLNNSFTNDVEITRFALLQFINNGFEIKAFEDKNKVKVIEIE